MKLFLVLGVLLALQSLFSLREGFRYLSRVRQSRKRPPGNYAPSAAVIIPCKGWSPDFDSNLSTFLDQDYPRFQLIFVVASQRDAAWFALTRGLEKAGAGNLSGGRRTRLIIAGFSEIRGEKVNNLIQGLAAVESNTEFLVFADIDARPPRHWLRSLVSPLEDPEVTVSTGFRWYLPGSNFVSQLRAAWDTSIATILGDRDWNFAWGGSMAVRARDFERLRVVERYWAHSLSDDYGLTRAVHAARGRIRFEPRCLLASREESSLREFLSWSTRQITLTRVYAVRLWLLGLASQGLYCLTFLLGLVLMGFSSAPPRVKLAIAVFLTGIVFLGMAKGSLRTAVARESFPEEDRSFERFGACYWRLAPLVPWVMLVNFVVSVFARRVVWRGTTYELRSADEVRVIHREHPGGGGSMGEFGPPQV